MKIEQEGTFFRKFMFKSFYCRNYCDQSKMNFEKLKEVYILKVFYYKKISHFSNNLLTGKYVRPKAGDFPGKNCQLDLEPFGIGISSGVWVRLPLISTFFGSCLNSINQWIHT